MERARYSAYLERSARVSVTTSDEFLEKILIRSNQPSDVLRLCTCIYVHIQTCWIRRRNDSLDESDWFAKSDVSRNALLVADSSRIRRGLVAS